MSKILLKIINNDVYEVLWSEDNRELGHFIREGGKIHFLPYGNQTWSSEVLRVIVERMEILNKK